MFVIFIYLFVLFECLLTFLQIGSLMHDEDSGTPVPILGVRISPQTGKVVPVGGVKSTDLGTQPIVPYDSYVDKMSGRQIRTHGAYTANQQVCFNNLSYKSYKQSFKVYV